MKKQLLSFALLLFISSLAFAQGEYKPVKGDFGIAFRVTGLQDIGFNNFSQGSLGIPQLLGRYYINERIAIRTTFGLGVNNFKSERTNTVTDTALQIISDTALVNNASAFSFAISPGIEYHLPVVTERLDVYVGGFIPLEIITGTNGEEDRDINTRMVSGENIYRESLNIKTNTSGGFAVGAGLLIGFNYFFAKKFSIGAEYSWAYISRRIGGDVKIATTGFVQVGNNTTTINATQDFKEVVTTSGMGVQSTAGVIASFFF